MVLVCERDWILLRARLRCFVELRSLPRMTTSTMAFEGEVASHEGEPETPRNG